MRRLHERFAQRRVGVDVTILEMMPHLLPNEEPEVSDVLEKSYKKLGVKFQTNAKVTDRCV